MIRYALLPIALLQIAMPALPILTDWAVPVGGESLQPVPPAPEDPPGAFFGIWSVIFLGYLLFALLALARERPVFKELASPLALTGLLGALWMALEQTVPESRLNYPILLAMLGASFWTAFRFDRMRGLGGSMAKFLGDMTSGLYAGWLSIAAAVSTTGLVRHAQAIDPGEAVWPMLALTLAIASTLAVLAARFVTRSRWYTAALVWGLAGLAISNGLQADRPLAGLLVAALALAITALRVRASGPGARAAA